MSVLLLNFDFFIEKNVQPLNKSLGFHSRCAQTLTKRPNSWHQKCYHVGTLKAFHLWTLGTSVKAKGLDSHSPPIKLPDFLHLSKDGHSVKTP